MSTTKDRLTFSEAYVYLGVEERFLRRLVAEKRIDYYKLGPGKRSPLLFAVVDLDAYLARCRVEAA